uniref:hypothetical protein n=1 Tax=Gilvibacter sp. TaxID=2729997 RepID=UPI0035BE9A8E
MHENLKYHISLSKEVSEFDGFLDENPRTNRDYRNSLSGWDPIYAATHYGTEYFIYAKFIGSYSEGKKNIEKIQLYLQNYSGAVTLGFQGTAKLIRRKMEENDPDINLEKNPNNIKYNLVVVLEAFNYQKYSTEITIFQDGSPVIEEGELMEVTPVFYPALIER